MEGGRESARNPIFKVCFKKMIIYDLTEDGASSLWELSFHKYLHIFIPLFTFKILFSSTRSGFVPHLLSVYLQCLGKKRTVSSLSMG